MTTWSVFQNQVTNVFNSLDTYKQASRYCIHIYVLKAHLFNDTLAMFIMVTDSSAIEEYWQRLTLSIDNQYE